MNRDVFIPILIAIGMTSAFTYFSSGLSLIVTFVPGVILALIFYFLTIFNKQPEPDKILPLYLLALGIQFIHFAEEYITGFNYKFPALFDSPEYPLNTFVAFNMLAYFMFILGAIMIYRKIKPPMIIPLFFVLYGIVGNAIAHVVFCIVAGGYFPGIYTASIYWIIGPIIMKRIWNETRTKNEYAQQQQI
jgi:hypothetical protein